MPRLAGIDPGFICGVVVLEVPPTYAIPSARWVDGQTFRPSKAADISTEALRDEDLYERLRHYLEQARVTEVAIEVAAEAKSGIWSDRGKAKQRTETAFRSGMYAQLAVLAAFEAGASVYTYPAVTSKARGPGWMGTSPRKVIVPRLLALLQAVDAPIELRARGADGELQQHHLADAVGVLAYHCAEQALLRRMPTRAASPVPA